MLPIVLALFSTLAAAAVMPRPIPPRSDDPEYVYRKAFRLRVAVDESYDTKALDAIPALSQRPYYFNYKPVSYGRNIAIAEPGQGPVFYENNTQSTISTATDDERLYPLTISMQYLDQFDKDYPEEHGVYVNRYVTLGIGPAPTHPPQMWGLAPGSYLVCNRKIKFPYRGYEDTLVMRFAYDVLGEDTNPPDGCVQVKLLTECANLRTLPEHASWNHNYVLDAPCVEVD